MNAELETVCSGKSLTPEQATHVMRQILSGSVSGEKIAAFLGALRAKGETREEIAAFASIMRAHSVRVGSPRGQSVVIDTCGTGGDGANTFNISTASALVLASGGVMVAKHGNRSVSSRCGSADVLEVLGVALQSTPQEAQESLEAHGFCFLFAPAFHPVLKTVAPVRRELGVKTVFNVLGPLANPAGVRRQVIGVFDMRLVETLAWVLKDLGSEEVMVVYGTDGAGHVLDEFTVCGETRYAHLRDGEVRLGTITPEQVGLGRHRPDELIGGDAGRNARIIRGIFEGENGARRDAVLFNAAAGFVVAGRARDFREGVTLAADSIDSGRARALLEKLADPEAEKSP